MAVVHFQIAQTSEYDNRHEVKLGGANDALDRIVQDVSREDLDEDHDQHDQHRSTR